MPRPKRYFLVDAHEDLGFHCQQHVRDLADPGKVPCMLTLGWMQQARLELVCATLFVDHDNPPELRPALLEAQYALYRDWLERFPDELRLVGSRRELAALAEAPDVIGQAGQPVRPIGLVLLMEGLELLRGPAELALWFGRGVRLAGLTWNGQNRFASGTFGDGGGLTPLGWDLLREFEQLGLILDLAHLNDRGITDVFSACRAPICSTHANARTLAAIERNLSDWQIREIGRRRGVIGHVLLAPFIIQPWKLEDPMPPLARALDHVEYVAGLAGEDCIGIGSDLDGGLTVENTPEGINDVRDLQRLVDGMRERGWSEERLAGFAGGNWWDFLERSLPH